MKRLLFLVLFFPSVAFAQESTKSDDKPFFADLVMGPYLFVDHHLYKSVILSGLRLGYENKNNLAYSVEYMSGHQNDVTGQLGTTHTANGQLTYFFKSKDAGTRFRPYFHLGGGFFEFKDFSKDVLGVAWNTGGGTELNFSKIAKGFLAVRYVNLGGLNIGGQHELGVMWGIRARF